LFAVHFILNSSSGVLVMDRVPVVFIDFRESVLLEHKCACVSDLNNS